MPKYDNINTNLDDITKPYDMPDEIKGNLFDYDTNADKNMWGKFSNQKSLMQTNQNEANNSINQNMRKGFAGSGARTNVKNKVSIANNNEMSSMIDNNMYSEYERKSKWQENQTGIIADSILAGDTTALGGYENYDPNATAGTDSNNGNQGSAGSSTPPGWNESMGLNPFEDEDGNIWNYNSITESWNKTTVIDDNIGDGGEGGDGDFGRP